jgi:hypothetical protein
MPHIIAIPTTLEELYVYLGFCAVIGLVALAAWTGALPPPGARTE